MPAAASFPSYELQARDVEILKGLLHARVMTRAHVAALWFGNRSEATKKRIGILIKAGLVGERPRRPAEPAILFITKRGVDLLIRNPFVEPEDHRDLAHNRRLEVSPLTLAHELSVQDVRVALILAVNGTDRFEITRFSTIPRQIEFKASPRSGMASVVLKPDAFIRIDAADHTSERCHYLEVDRSTESLERLATKALCYANHYRSGGFARERYGLRPERYKEAPFTVLMILKTKERMLNLAERLLRCDPPILSQVWLSTMDEVLDDPVGAIWMRPRDYRDAVVGNEFNLSRPLSGGIYARHMEREVYVDSTVKKLRLLDEAA